MHAYGPCSISAQSAEKKRLAFVAMTARLMRNATSSAPADSMRAYQIASYTFCLDARCTLRESTRLECK